MGMAKLWLVYLCLVVVSTYSAPLDAVRDRKEMEELRERMRELRDLPGLDKEEYLRYWQEMAKNDPKVMERLKNVGSLRHGNERADLQRLIEDNPLLGERLARGSDDIRSRLEEAKRMNIEQMRQLQRLQTLREDNALRDGDWNTKLEALREKLPPHFTDEDIQERIKEQNRILEDIDKKRHEEFKKAEMHAEHRRRELLKAMDEKKRLKAEEEFQAQKEKLKHHEKLHHPGSEQQLEDVWEKDDGLKKDEFDPKTFFHLHDKNSDRHLDPAELEALFYNELRKVYGDDMGGMEAHEDLARMREHVISEMDKNNDGLVSMQEFITYTKDDDFKEDEGWQTVQDEDIFSDKEFEKYEEDYDQYYDYEYDEHGNLIGYKTKQKGSEVDEQTEDKMPNRHLPPKDQGDTGVPNINEQGQPPINREAVPGVPPVNNQGNPPSQNAPKMAQQEIVNNGLPSEMNIPQVDDPKAVHVNGMEKNVDQGVPVVHKQNEEVPQQNPNEI